MASARIVRVAAAFLAASALAWHAGSLAAVIQEVRVSFNPATITVDETTDLRIEVKTSQGNIETGMDIEVPLRGLFSVGAMTFENCFGATSVSTGTSVSITGLKSNPGRTCLMSVRIGAPSPGAYEFTEGWVVVTSDGLTSGNSEPATLQVLASAPAVFVASPASLDFGDQLVDTSSAMKTVTLRNDGGSPLAILGISKSGDFTYLSDCPSSLSPTGSCTLQVTFAPAANGLATGWLQVASDAAASPIVIGLSGTGIELERTVPQLSLSSTALAFGDIASGSTALLRVRIESTGTESATISTVGIDGDAFSQSHDCASSLVPGDGCDIWVAFAPTSAGNYSGALTLSTSAGPFVLQLSGSAFALPVLAVAPPSLNFGLQTINVASATQAVTITNEGAANLVFTATVASGDEFTFTSGCSMTLAPGGSCTLAVTFQPRVLGSRSGRIDISSNASEIPYSVVLTGSGTQAPVPGIVATPSSANLGAILVGTTSSARFVLSSTGQADLSIAGISVTGAYFGQSNTCPPVLAPGAACEIEATYAPTVAGSHAGEVHVTSNAVPSPLVIPLSASALAATSPALALSRDHLAFGQSFVNMVSSPGMITVTNAGTGPMNIASIATEGDFGYSGCGFPSTLLPGESCALWITFRPLSEGPVVGRMQVFSDAPGSPHSIALSGTGILGLSPQIELTPSALDFGTLRVGDDEAAPMRLTNVGNMALAISAISTAGAAFSQANSCPASLAPGASCDIEVTYAPSAAGAHSGQLRIDSNATPARYIAALSGTATPVPPPFMVVARVVDFGQQLTRTAARATLEIRNSGGMPLVINAIQFFGASVFGVEGSCGAIAPRGACSLTVVFAPTAAGAIVGRMEIASNHSRGVVVVELVGQGVRSPHPDLELSVEGLGFGNQVIGSLGDQRIVGLANAGSLPLQFRGFDASVDFLVDSSRCPAQLQPDESCEVRVTFKPVAPGPRGGELTITSNAIGAPHAVSLTGTGCRFFTMRAARSGQPLCGP